jgi:hypothetical protein
MTAGNRGGALRAASCALVVAAIAALCACGTSHDGEAASTSNAATPRFASGFADDLAAQMTTSANRLWVAVAGRPTLGASVADAELRVFSLSAASTSWTQTPLPLDGIDTSEPFFVAPWNQGICLAASRRQRPVILCSDDGRAWTKVALAGVGRDARIVDLATTRSAGTLAVILNRSSLLTVRLGGDGHAARAARPLPGGPLLARLGADAAQQPLLATRRAGGGGELSLYGFRDGVWTPRAAPIDVGLGPQLGGPVGDGHDVVIPVVQAAGSVWPLRIARLSGGKMSLGPSVNTGDGSAQGLVEPDGAHPLAIWQQHAAGRGRTFRASIYVKDVSAGSSGRPRLLWSGYDIGPGDLGVQEFDHRVWSLTTRAQPGHVDKALRVYVSPLPGG